MFTREQILSGNFTRHPYDRIFSRVKKSVTGCLEFQGGLDSHGYGRIKINGHNLGAHKISYILSKGDVSEGLEVMHSCDNRKCVNPDHLSLGTHKENMMDMVSKNRGNYATRQKGNRGREGKGLAANIYGAGISFWYPSFASARRKGFYYRHIARSIKVKSTYNGYHWLLA